MSKKRPTIGENGFVLPVLPPERDPRLWTRMVRVMFFTPGFVALLLIKAGEPAAFGVTIELLLLHELPIVIRNSAGMVSVTVPIVARVLLVAMKLFGFWLVAYMVLSFPVARMTMFTEVSLGSSGNPALSCL